jgi:hypothetical protein
MPAPAFMYDRAARADCDSYPELKQQASKHALPILWNPCGTGLNLTGRFAQRKKALISRDASDVFPSPF